MGGQPEIGWLHEEHSYTSSKVTEATSTVENNIDFELAFTASNLEVEVASCIDIMHETDYSFDNVQSEVLSDLPPKKSRLIQTDYSQLLLSKELEKCQSELEKCQSDLKKCQQRLNASKELIRL